MGQIKSYMSVTGETLEDLDEAVTEYLDEGWQPYGDQYFDEFLYIQPMVSNKK